MAQKSKVKVSGRKKILVFSGCSAAFLILAVIIGVNFVMIRDVLIGMGYKPSEEMSLIRDSLELTNRGRLIFNASKPELMEKNEFNLKCRDNENEVAILGCFSGDKIYVYNIVDEELPGIRELTTAHELLHAVYERMSDADKTALVSDLTQVFENNQSLLEPEITIYEISEREEELYVRAGTEVKELPLALEEHFAKYFKDQDKIVDFYESYIAIFHEIEEKLSSLLSSINVLQEEINTKTENYETGTATLNAEIEEFNNCAETLNCFSSNAVFNSRRAALISRQQGLKALYEEINALISQYNTLVAEYNENVLHGQALNIRINSSLNVEEVGD